MSTCFHLDVHPRMTPIVCNKATPFGIVLLIIFGMVSIAGLLGNGFIIVVNSHSWLQSKKLVPCDLLLTCLSIFRFFMQCAALLSQYIYVRFSVDYMCSFIRKGIALAWLYFNMTNFAGTTCLTVFYCVKVTTFAHPLFLWLKSRIDRLVPRMLVMSLTFSVPPVVGFWKRKTSCWLTRNLTTNTSHTNAHEEFPFILNPLQFSFNAINFSICLTASILLIVSLWRHTRNLKRSGIGTKDLSTQAHIEVIKQLMFFLFFYILYFVAMIIALDDFLEYGTIERLISDTVLSSYPFAHSINLIRTNPKLKGVCARILSSRERCS
ncbi:hypothetical protein lerEdw1_015473 [Lerista edwardsae]|nr:hypothetical protein lerEdw1_015473 [Lerista edwardsae]